MQLTTSDARPWASGCTRADNHKEKEHGWWGRETIRAEVEEEEGRKGKVGRQRVYGSCSLAFGKKI